MKTADINISLINGYLRMMENLTPGSKLDFISKLTLSVKDDISSKKRNFYKAFGAWESDKSADEIIGEIRNSRKFGRHIEGFWR